MVDFFCEWSRRDMAGRCIARGGIDVCATKDCGNQRESRERDMADDVLDVVWYVLTSLCVWYLSPR